MAEYAPEYERGQRLYRLMEGIQDIECACADQKWAYKLFPINLFAYENGVADDLVFCRSCGRLIRVFADGRLPEIVFPGG